MSVPAPDPARIAALIDAMKAGGAAGLMLPPPVYETLATQPVDFRPGDADGIGAELVMRFPNEARWQNPVGHLQGGVLAAFVDGVVGPLSYLVAPPSATTDLSVSYLAPATGAVAAVEIAGRLVQRAGRTLVFDAEVRAVDAEGSVGGVLALARVTNRIVRALRTG